MPERHSSYWETSLPEPAGAELPLNVDVLIVGAGFMGSWLAYFLARHQPDLSVLVLERDRFAYGASSRNAGFITCGQISEMLADTEHAGEDLVIETFLKRREGIALVRREFPDLDVDPCGSLDHDEVTGPKRELALKLNAAAGEDIYSVKDARLGARTRPAFFNSADGGAHPVDLLRRIRLSCGRAVFAFGVEVRRIGKGLCEVERGGQRQEVRYSRAFVCTNAFARSLDASSTVVPGRGQVIVTSPVSTPTDKTLGYLNLGYDYFRFIDGRLLLGGGRDKFPAEHGAAELEPTGELRDYLTGVARSIIGHDDWSIEHHWAGVMGFVGGGHLGGSPRRKLDASTEVVAGFGGMGVALTPIYAQQIAREL